MCTFARAICCTPWGHFNEQYSKNIYISPSCITLSFSIYSADCLSTCFSFEIISKTDSMLAIELSINSKWRYFCYLWFILKIFLKTLLWHYDIKSLKLTELYFSIKCLVARVLWANLSYEHLFNGSPFGLYRTSKLYFKPEIYNQSHREWTSWIAHRIRIQIMAHGILRLTHLGDNETGVLL